MSHQQGNLIKKKKKGNSALKVPQPFPQKEDHKQKRPA